MVPSPDDIDTTKLGIHAGLIMTDSCNAAQKARCLLQHKIGGIVVLLDCHHHLRNVWIKGLEQSVSSYLRVIVTGSLEKTPPEIRVTCVYSVIARARDKFFSLCANYPKGQGEHSAAWSRVNKPDTPLYHVIGAQGSRQDLCLMAAPAIYMNRYACFDYACSALAKEARQHFAKVLVCVNDFGGDYFSVMPVCHPLDLVLFANALASSQDTRAWTVGLGTHIKRRCDRYSQREDDGYRR